MTCFLCLQPGGMQDACPCPSAAVHVECLARFLQHTRVHLQTATLVTSADPARVRLSILL